MELRYPDCCPKKLCPGDDGFEAPAELFKHEKINTIKKNKSFIFGKNVAKSNVRGQCFNEVW